MNSEDQNETLDLEDQDQLSKNNISHGDFLAVSQIDKTENLQKKQGKKYSKSLHDGNLMILSLKV